MKSLFFFFYDIDEFESLERAAIYYNRKLFGTLLSDQIPATSIAVLQCIFYQFNNASLLNKIQFPFNEKKC